MLVAYVGSMGEHETTRCDSYLVSMNDSDVLELGVDLAAVPVET